MGFSVVTLFPQAFSPLFINHYIALLSPPTLCFTIVLAALEELLCDPWFCSYCVSRGTFLLVRIPVYRFFLSFSFQIIHRSLMGFGRPGMRMRYLPYIGIPTVLEFVFWFFFGRSRMRDERSLEQCGIPSLTARVLQLCDCDIYLSLPCSYSGSIKRR